VAGRCFRRISGRERPPDPSLAVRWALIALVADFADLFLMDAVGGISDYQRLDKLCDLGYIATFLAVAARWSGLERVVALGLFAYRIDHRAIVSVPGGIPSAC
jgi:hypothetical protein